MSTRDVVRLLEKRQLQKVLELLRKKVITLDQFAAAAEARDPMYWDRVKFIFEAVFEQ